MNDTELIEGCKAGKREALETIYRLFSRQMYGVCYRYVGEDSLFIIRTAYGPEAEKINLLAGLLQEAGLQGEIKVACGVEALGCLFGLKRYQSVISGFSYHSGADRNISLSIRWMVKRWF